MSISKSNNLKITEVSEDILLVHQIKPPSYFSCCDGLLILPKEGRNKLTIALDLNVDPYLIQNISDVYGPVSDYVCSHCHMDHITHIHQWESLGATIHAPIPENSFLLDLYNFYEGFGFNNRMEYSVIEKFAKASGFNPCNSVKPFKPGVKLKFEDFVMETVHFKSHSQAHVGFLLPADKILHISCLGFDKPKPELDGFGPWYGFSECSISQYLKDIDLAESFFLNQAKFLTSSHSYIVINPDTTPFEYMRDKIEKNQIIVDQAISSLNLSKMSGVTMEDFLELDLFFPKRKMKGYILEIYNYWESEIISKHIERSKY
ncbi:hypothetical protein LCGC14_2333700 [marine sediment metagenome]|uniref:Metallo-beta-lactamase domain-containing protein n=1 Tax=marine sediment metagenome TaxID=412755 RepID=A0A0F9F927_9ZZZZ